MKKILLLLSVLIGFSAISYAQVSHGIKAGVNFPQIKSKRGNLSYVSSTATSFYLTGYIDVPLTKHYSIQPGLSLQGKGAKLNAGEFDFSEGATDSYMYLEVPVNFVYSIQAGNGSVFMGAGPYIGLGVLVKTTVGNISESGSFDDAGLNGLDAGLNFLAGYKLTKGFLINAGYGLGLANIVKDALVAFSTTNRLFSVGVGYQF